VLIVAAGALAAGQAHSADQRTAQRLLEDLNSQFNEVRTITRLQVTGSPPSQIATLSTVSKVDGKQFRYRGQLRDFDPSTVRVLAGAFGPSVFVVCRREAKCVTASDGLTGQVIMPFSYLELGPLRSDAGPRVVKLVEALLRE
jgi:hypothetical protein